MNPVMHYLTFIEESTKENISAVMYKSIKLKIIIKTSYFFKPRCSMYYKLEEKINPN